MSGTAELQDLEPAVKTLLVRSLRLQRRAGRARVGSNEREKCVGQATLLRACAEEIATDKKLQKTLRDRKLLGRGWRALWGVTVEHVRIRERASKWARAWRVSRVACA